MDCCYELGFTWPSLSEAMFLATEDVKSVKVLHEMAVDFLPHGNGTV